METFNYEKQAVQVRTKVTPAELIGQFFYQDGTFSSEVLDKETVGGIVACSDEHGFYVISLNELMMSWEKKHRFVIDHPEQVFSDRGEFTTENLMALADRLGIELQPLIFCKKTILCGKHGFLPSATECKKIWENYGKINRILSNAGFPLLNGEYWTCKLVASEDQALTYNFTKYPAVPLRVWRAKSCMIRPMFYFKYDEIL